MDYRLASDFATSYCDEQNAEILKKYIKHFDKKGVKYETIENFKNCLLFAGALFDSMNDGLPEWKVEQRKQVADELAKKIDFSNYNNLDVIEKNLEYLCTTLKRVDPKNAEKYQSIYKEASPILNEYYKQEKGKRKGKEKESTQIIVEELNK